MKTAMDRPLRARDLKNAQDPFKPRLSMEAKRMGRVLDKFSKHSQIDVEVIETELFAAFKALEADPENLTVDELRQSLLIYLDEIFYGISPDKVQ
jgi:hypothetical protein